LTSLLTSLSDNDSPGPSNESNQTKTVSSVAMVSGSVGTIGLSGFNFVYTPPGDFNGTVFATYVVRDNGAPAEQTTGTITINVTEVNDAPVAVNATREAFVGSTVTINLANELAQASRGAANESGQTVRINRILPRSVSSASNGTATLNNDGTISYTPSASITEETVDVFQYEIIDNGTTNGSSDPKTGIAQVSVTVKPFQSSTVRGRIWIDDNNSGGYDRPELFMQGVLVTLNGRPTGATQDITPVITRTDNAGNYSFSNVRPGSYTVSFAKPAFTVDAPEAEQQSFNIAVPGNRTVDADFRILAVSTVNNVLWDNLLSSYYRRNGQEWAHRGFTALVGANGATQWNIHRGGFESYSRVDVSMNAQGIPQIDAYFVNAQGNMQHSRASVPRSQFLSVGVDGGNTLVRIFAMPDELAFTNVGATPAVSAEGFGYESVDGIFANDEWL
jgi:Bacterial Ig domain/SdrD B-like domain